MSVNVQPQITPKNPFVCPKNPGLITPTFLFFSDQNWNPKKSYSIGRGTNSIWRRWSRGPYFGDGEDPILLMVLKSGENSPVEVGSLSPIFTRF